MATVFVRHWDAIGYRRRRLWPWNSRGDEGKGIRPILSFGNVAVQRNGRHRFGLSIARAIARQHGGDISLISGETGMQTIVSLPREGDHWRGVFLSGPKLET
ncbi:ATP-binding protein [Rhizobium leguminosarum]|uniref:ATP-binding protein n=1 Tax=Rhizobium leguminosarum TaxID=384 RepID=UPI003965856B